MIDNMDQVIPELDWRFPEKAPRIGIVPVELPSEPVRVILKGDPFHFGSFQVGDEFAVCDYDLPNENLTQVTRGLTRGPVCFQGKNCTEILCREVSPSGEMQQLIRRLVTKSSRFGQVLLTVSRRSNGMGTVEITGLEFPLHIEPKSKWTVSRRSVANRSGYVSSNVERITGLVDVFMGKSKYRCLRWLRPRTVGIGYHETEEIFVEVNTGLTVLLRAFVGKGFPDLERYQRSPKLEVTGEIFYLRFIRRVIRQSSVILSDPVL
ncbi:hypothetical protein K8T06_03095 [bacterium]|nr:hypothetical protein [bacterium]